MIRKIWTVLATPTSTAKPGTWAHMAGCLASGLAIGVIYFLVRLHS